MHTFLSLSCLIECLGELIVKTVSELLIGHNTLLCAYTEQLCDHTALPSECRLVYCTQVLSIRWNSIERLKPSNISTLELLLSATSVYFLCIIVHLVNYTMELVPSPWNSSITCELVWGCGQV